MRGAGTSTAFLLAGLIAASGAGLGFELDIRSRLERRWPSCRGVLEGVYTGDELGFMHRAIFETSSLSAVVLMEKDRGEDWVDLLAAGAGWSGEAGPLRSASIGWLRVGLGTGLVLRHPGGWGGSLEAAGKPPARRTSIRPATSASACDGEPLTAAAVRLDVCGVDLAILQGLSRTDGASTEGYHRTEGELESRGSVTELLTALRAERRAIGLTLAVGQETGDREGCWFRSGVDLAVLDDSAPVGLVSELVAGGTDSTDLSVGGYASPHLEAGSLRACVAFYCLPEALPSNRMSSPYGSAGETGMALSARFRPGSGVAAGASLEYSGENTLREETGLEGRFRVDYRFRTGLETFLKLRASTGGAEDARYLGGTAGLDWQADDYLRLSARVHLALSRDEDADSVSNGSAIETRVRLSLSPELEIKLSGAAYSTEDYDSRVYLYEIAFPGEFGCASAQGEGLLMQAAMALHLEQRAVLRARLRWLTRESVDFLGSGYEETDGNSRTEAGLQLDWKI